MDSDVCDLDVDQNLHLFLPAANPSHESSHSTSSGRNHFLGGLECHPHHSLDSPMPTSRRGLEH